jgi:RNA polymerase sigma-70 factor (ECF subfamily)
VLSNFTSPEGFDDRIDELGRLAYRVGYRILGDRGEAEDVAQETLARAYARWSTVHRHAEPWVVRVATNHAIGVWRKRRPADAVGDIAVRSHAQTAADRIDLARVIAALPRRQREVVALRFLADLPERETAAALGCSIGSVKQHTHRAMASLRLALTEPAPVVVPDPGAH